MNIQSNIPLSERVALTPAEFASCFGHQQTWAYRQIYAGKVKIIADMGRMMIPKGEMERLQKGAGIYDGSLKVKYV